uniref:Uncharacterized protein n=1 Tax=Palpitomonas bilix TaxID=652834 RepID=A0A7S3G588_9EUKA|mmetsp:Transcript_22832/g.58110  ORF Transcript_22832/g.58110 Transcript_22832/m.58110 type:complete len:196 (+) Transcript_22832:165-752(+)
MYAKSGGVSLFCVLFLLPACLASSIPFDALRQANVTAILAISEYASCDIFSELTSEKCFDDTVILTSGDTLFFIPLMARTTPECFDFATYGGQFRPATPYTDAADAHFFKADTIVTKISYYTYKDAAPNTETFVDTNSSNKLCYVVYDLKAGHAGISKPAPEDVSPEDVEEWKQVIADNIDMLEEKYGRQGSRWP